MWASRTRNGVPVAFINTPYLLSSRLNEKLETRARCLKGGSGESINCQLQDWWAFRPSAWMKRVALVLSVATDRRWVWIWIILVEKIARGYHAGKASPHIWRVLFCTSRASFKILGAEKKGTTWRMDDTGKRLTQGVFTLCLFEDRAPKEWQRNHHFPLLTMSEQTHVSSLQ